MDKLEETKGLKEASFREINQITVRCYRAYRSFEKRGLKGKN